MSASQAAAVLVAADKTQLGSGLYIYHLVVRVDDMTVLIDPLPEGSGIASGQERIFRGTLEPGKTSETCILVGRFVVSWFARLVFFPVPLMIGIVVGAVAIAHRSPFFGVLSALFLYFASGYVVPRLMVIDTSRSEAMVREWLPALLCSNRDGPRR